jgi:hypothetical protein
VSRNFLVIGVTLERSACHRHILVGARTLQIWEKSRNNQRSLKIAYGGHGELESGRKLSANSLFFYILRVSYLKSIFCGDLVA